MKNNEPIIAPTPESEFKDRLNDMLGRYAKIFDDSKAKVTTKVWDTVEQREYNKSLFEEHINCKELVKQWRRDKNALEINQSDVLNLVAKQQKKKADKDKQEDNKTKEPETLVDVINRYIFVGGENKVWDNTVKKLIDITSLRNRCPRFYDFWLKSSDRITVEFEDIVFDPTNSYIPRYSYHYINTYDGLAIKPLDVTYEEAEKIAEPILRVIKNLCENNDEIFTFVINWLALPLQNEGLKLDTALVFHDNIEGTGKSMIFANLMRTIYGDYLDTIKSVDLSSQFNEYLEDKLFLTGEEITQGKSRYEMMGFLKELVTGKITSINRKGVSVKQKRNYANLVLLSNDDMPISPEVNDRRFVVCRPSERLPKQIYDKVGADLDSQEKEMTRAFYQYLLLTDTGEQTAHSPAIDTESKQRLIRTAQPNWEVFLHEWKNGGLGDVPHANCLSRDLYKLYECWCNEGNEYKMPSNKFLDKVNNYGGYDKRRIKHPIWQSDPNFAVSAKTTQSTIICISLPNSGDYPVATPTVRSNTSLKQCYTQGELVAEQIRLFRAKCHTLYPNAGFFPQHR